MQNNAVKLEASWLKILADEFEKPYMRALKAFLKVEKQQGKKIYPPGDLIFNALNSTPFDQVKVVILGQDPYHGPNQAHGLCFSVMPGVPLPPSLKNIYKELATDVGVQQPDHGSLQAWANQGVLLLNAMLTVEHGKAGAHQGKGWEEFTDSVIRALNEQRQGLVYLLWGSYAQKKGEFIDRNRNLVLQSPHPSPFSAHRGFLGNKHFSKTNDYLISAGLEAIDWQVPSQAD
ncbi:uracil-DNA glycosylase [Aurantivibrio infirmus]